MIYQIVNWDQFENNKSREREKCGYVCVPNQQEGMGLSIILAEPDGAVIYGIWCLFLGACSRQGKHRNGWMTADGHRTGTAWTPRVMAVQWRRTEAEIIRALEVLSSPEVGWIAGFSGVENEGFTEVKTPTGQQVPAECPPSAPSRASEEMKRNEMKRNEDTPTADAGEVPMGKAEKQAKNPASDRAYSFADWFRTTLPDDIKLSTSWRERWARCYDDLIRLDSRTPEAIAAVCKWARNDSFWSSNFLSPLKLRDKNAQGVNFFDTFVANMAKRPSGAQTAADRKAAGAHREYGLKDGETPDVFDPMEDEEDEV